MITQTILIDTGPIVALLSHRDAYHIQCVEQARQLPHTLYTCWPVMTEAAYILRNTPSAVDGLLELVWCVILGLSRYGGHRTPSETLSLRWEDIHWELRRVSSQ